MGQEADSYQAGLAAYSRGDMRGAASGFLMAFALAPDSPAYRAMAFEILNLMSGYRSLPAAVIAGLEHAADEGREDLQPLALVVKNLFEGDERLRTLQGQTFEELESSLCDAAWLLDNRLLRAVLTGAVNISAPLENVFTRLRRHLCETAAQHRATILLTRFREFSVALAAQCVINRFVWPETEAERAFIDTVGTAPSSVDILIVRAAYRPLLEIAEADAERLPPALLALWKEEAHVRNRARALPQLTTLAPGLSAAMQAQYEAYPYPRWRQMGPPSTGWMAAFAERSGQSTNHASNAPLDVLVAGCGTGRPALTIARTFGRAQVTAIDLSRTSLAYAQHMAEKLAIPNITFAIADILALGEWNQRFHLIECSGVLHHMSDPAAGLRTLRGLLRDDGAMLVSLYSERGRAAEIAAQAFVKDRAFPDTPEGLRSARAEILALPLSHPARAVTATPDFFTRDGLHDLIFNLHEARFTPGAMKRLLQSCNLTPFAVDAPTALGGAAFQARHPQPGALADLDLWDSFEQENPQVFAHMIQVWCRPS